MKKAPGASHQLGLARMPFMSPVDRTSETIGRGLVGTYLHGSAALRGFVPGRSDINELMIRTIVPPVACGPPLRSNQTGLAGRLCVTRWIGANER